MKTRTQEQIARGGELIDALCLLFQPFVEAACRPKLVAELSAPPPTLDLSDEVIEGLGDVIRECCAEDGKTPEETEEAVTRAKDELTNPTPYTAEEIEQSVKDESNNECAQLVRNWLNAYFCAEDDANGERTVAASDIDDAMLPPLGFVLKHGFPDGQTGEQLFAECCNGLLDANETRAVLRQVKATLSPGRPMPAEALEFLQLEEVTIS